MVKIPIFYEKKYSHNFKNFIFSSYDKILFQCGKVFHPISKRDFDFGHFFLSIFDFRFQDLKEYKIEN
jgi:hypothetical protein